MMITKQYHLLVNYLVNLLKYITLLQRKYNIQLIKQLFAQSTAAQLLRSNCADVQPYSKKIKIDTVLIEIILRF